MPLSRQSIKRLTVIWLISAIVAGVCTIWLLPRIPQQEVDEQPQMIKHDIPAEVLCRSAATVNESMPQAILSDKPLLRLREYAPGHYELLYWGNPVRPHYTFSIQNVRTGKSVLLNAEGKREKWRDLPVTQPHRADKKLPLQPAIPLNKLHGARDSYFAARIAVHDATTGKILCSAIYLLCGNSN